LLIESARLHSNTLFLKSDQLTLFVGQSRTNNANSLLRNLSNFIKHSHQANDEPIHIVFVTCTIPLIHHTSLGEQSPESILIQDLARIATLSIISPFTKNLLSSCIKMKKLSNPNSNVNHNNLFLFFNYSQNVLIENQQNDSILVHPVIAELVKNNNSNLSNIIQSSKVAASPYAPPMSIKSQSVSTPVSAPSPSAYPPPIKLTKDVGAGLTNITQAKSSPAVSTGKMSSSPVNSNNSNMQQQQNQQQPNQQQIGNTFTASTNVMQQKISNQNIQQQSTPQMMASLVTNTNTNQPQQQQTNPSQSPFIPSGSLLDQAQLQQQQQKLLQQHQLQLKNMYQQQTNVNPSTLGNVMNNYMNQNNNQNNNFNNMMGGSMNNMNAMNMVNNMGLQNTNLNNQQILFQQQQQQQYTFLVPHLLF
jgi:hypothetical protein